MNNIHNTSIPVIVKKALLTLVCAFIFVSNFEITKVLALTDTQEKNNVYGPYHNNDYPQNFKTNTVPETIRSEGIDNYIHFELDKEEPEISDSSFVYEYSVDEYTTVYESSDNKDYKKIEITNEIVNYETDKNVFEPIDTTVCESAENEYEYENNTNTIESYYPALVEDGLRFKVKDTSLSYKPLLIQNNEPQIYDDQLIYPFNDDINLHYLIHNSFIKENIILNTPVDTNTFQYEIDIENGSFYLSDNRLYVKDNYDKDIFYIEAPIAYDSSGNSTDINISLEKNILTYSIDYQWLKDETRVYPITLDPSFVYILDNDGSDISVIESEPDKTIGLGNETIDKYLYLGSDSEYGKSYSFYTYANYKKAPKNIIVDSFILKYDIESIDNDNTLNYGIIEDDIEFAKITYNDLNSIKEKLDVTETTKINSSDTDISIDLTDYTKGLLQQDKQNSFVFMYLEDDQHSMRLDSLSCKIEFRFHYPTDEDEQFNNLRYYLRPFVKNKANEGITEFVSLGVDGSDTLGRNISVSLYKEDELLQTKSTAVNDYLYNYPDYPLIDDCPDKYNSLVSNWQLDSLFSDLEADKLYTIRISDGYFESQETFRLYTVKDFVLIQNIASFYGVDILTLLKDNNLTDSLIYEGNLLYIANPSMNSDLDYVPEDLSDVNSAINAFLRGNSADENSNIITGNFLYENTDFTLLESELQFDLIRTYNSSSHNNLSTLGYGFDFSYNSYVQKGKNGAILLLPDGSKLFFNVQDGKYINNLSSNYDLKYNNDHFELLFRDDNTRYIFGSFGYLEKIIYHTGKTITLSYSNRLLSKVDLGNNTSLSFSYNKRSLLTDVKASDGTGIKYEYDDKANLVSFTDQLGNKTTYEYDDNHLMISYKDFNGKLIYKNEYNSDNKLSKQTDSLGNSHTLDYMDNRVIFTDSKDNKTIYHYDENYYTSKVEYPDGSFELYEYDLGILKSYTNKFNLGFKYTYDSHNNLIKEERSDGFTTDNSYDERNNLLESTNSLNQKFTYTYDENNNPLTKTDSLNNTYTYTYNSDSKLTSETDPKGNKTTYEYDDNNNLIKIIYPDNTYHKMSYNESGFLVSLTNEKGQTETHTLDDKNQLLAVTYPDGSKEKYEYDNNGNIIRYENRNKAVSKYEYNSNNRLIRSTDPKGNVTGYEYDSNSNLLKTSFPDGSYIINEYDCLDRLIKKDTSGYIEEYSYNHFGLKEYSNPLENTSYEYDYLGNIIKLSTNDLVTLNEYDPLSRLIKTTDEKGITEVYEYDLNNQLIKQISPLKAVEFTYDCNGNIISEVITSIDSIRSSSYEYDSRNNLIKKTDSLNNEYRYEYDGLLLTKQIFPSGNSISYSYDSNSRITSITDQNSNVSYKKYDYEGNIIEEIDNNGNITKYTYDLNDNLISKINPDGGIYSYEYDSNNKLIKEVSPLSKVTGFSYDLYGNILETRINDRLISSFIYDKDSKLLLSETTNDLIKYFEYDQKGNLIKYVNPYGQTFDYEYDKYNRLIEESTDEGILSMYTYNDYDLALSETDKYGKTIQYTYNDDLNLVSKKDHNKIYSYEYDLLDNLIKEVDYLNNTTTYEYDSLNRLIRTATNDRISAYEYDSAGNIISFTDPENQTTKYTYDSNNNLIRKVSSDNHIYEYVYDSLNRLIEEKADGISVSRSKYDLDNRLIESYDGENNKTAYIYDNFGSNISIIDPKGFKTDYQYDNNFNLIRTIDPKGNITTDVYNKLNQLVETIDPKGNSVYYEYDRYNNLSKYTSQLGGVSTYNYNYKGQLIKQFSSSGLRKTYSYNINNDITEVYYNDKLNSRYIYDDYFRLIEEYDALAYKKSYEYDSYNNIISFHGEHDYSRSYRYDNLNRLTEKIDSMGLISTYSYDSNDNIVTEQISDSIYSYLYDSRNNLIEYIDPDSNIYKYEYDKADRLIKETNPLNISRSYKYDENANLIEEKDYNSNITKHIYDEKGNLIQDIDPLGNIKTYSYDQNNNLSSVQNESGYISVYDYDSANNLISIKNNILSDNSHLISYEYDDSNRLIKARSYEGIIEEYEYDNKDNIINYKQGNTAIRYHYDLNDNLIQKDNITYRYDRLNRLIKVVDNSGTSTYSYNSESDLLSVNQSSHSIRYVYNSKHQIISVNYGDNRKIEYTYDLSGNIKSIRDNDSFTSYTYDKLNRQIKTETVISDKENTNSSIYGFRKVYADDENIITTYRSYDNNSNIISINSYLNNSEILEEKYDYDLLNRLTGKYSNRNNNVSNIKYKYNEAGQLIETDNNGTRNIYTRSLDGKTISIEGNSSTINEYNDDGQLIRSTLNNKSTTYRYDDRGNRISETTDNKTINYTYDKYNNLIKIANPDGYFFEYEYDGLNNRVSLTVPYKVYIHPRTGLDSDMKNELLSNNSNSFKNTLEQTRYKKLYYLNDYTTGNDNYIGIRIDDKYRYTTIGNNNTLISSNNSYLLSDYQSSSVLSLSKDDQSDIITINYSDYGITNIDYNPLDDNSLSLSYTNQDLSLNRLIYLHSRYYDPKSQSFISKDTYKGNIYDTSSLNGYNYCDNDPINHIDPSGHRFVNVMMADSGSGGSRIIKPSGSNKPSKPAGNSNTTTNKTYVSSSNTAAGNTNNTSNTVSSSTNSSTGSVNTYTPPPKKVSNKVISSSATADNNIGLWQRIVNGAKSLGYGKSAYINNPNKQIQSLDSLYNNQPGLNTAASLTGYTSSIGLYALSAINNKIKLNISNQKDTNKKHIYQPTINVKIENNNTDSSYKYNKRNAVEYALQYGINPNKHDDYVDFSDPLYSFRYFLQNKARLGQYFIGQDCTNFISQCLKAGGIEETDEWYYRNIQNELVYSNITIGGGNNLVLFKDNDDKITVFPDKQEFSQAWSMAAYSYEYFSNIDNGYTDKQSVFISNVEDIEKAVEENNIEQGDLMYFCKEIKGEVVPTHASIIVDIKQTSLSSTDIIYAAHTTNKIDGILSEVINLDEYAGVKIILMKGQ